jgi:hypothetical protein
MNYYAIAVVEMFSELTNAVYITSDLVRFPKLQHIEGVANVGFANGNSYGGKLQMGMTTAMCHDVVNKGCYDISRRQDGTEIWNYNQEKARAALMLGMAGDGMGARESVAAVMLLEQIGFMRLSDMVYYKRLTFQNGKLTGFTQ